MSATQPVPLTPAAAPDATGEAAEQPGAGDVALRSMLARVSAARGLKVLAAIPMRVEHRDALERIIRDKTEREMPPEVLLHEAEALVALGLVPPSYDSTDGMLSMLGTSLTGFYEPDNKTMYLAADLSEGERSETLAHELVHALQDQHYDIGPMFKYAPDTDEATAAGHALAEGDATSAMFEISLGGGKLPGEEAFAEAATSSIDKLVPDVPIVLRRSLISSYTDGYAFVQALRRRGDFAAVDAVWRAPPATTEQVLHLDKYDAREAAIAVEPPTLAPLSDAKQGRRFSQVYSQVIGEQGLRIALEIWSDKAKAAQGAAGWGGDRYALAHGEGAAAGEVALAWHLVLDTEKDAKEVAAILSSQAHGDCVARPDVGPFAWSRSKRDIALSMGPYAPAGKKARSTGSCKEARAWLAAILAPTPGR